MDPEVLMDDSSSWDFNDCDFNEDDCNEDDCNEDDCNDAVLEVPFHDVVGIMLEAGHIRGAGARFPEPLALLERGAPTDIAQALGLVEGGKLAPDADIRIHKAYRSLLETGRFRLMEKWGYTWIVPGDARKYVDQSALRAAVANVVGYSVRTQVWDDLA